MALGVIFAATDSVAVLQVLQQDRMPLLYSLVFGEGVINDATSVALLRAVQVWYICAVMHSFVSHMYILMHVALRVVFYICHCWSLDHHDMKLMTTAAELP